MLIDINDYTKIINGATVLDHVTLHMEGGRVYGLKGPNGSGKTMLMRAVCGLIKPTSGSVVIDGETLGRIFPFPEVSARCWKIRRSSPAIPAFRI